MVKNLNFCHLINTGFKLGVIALLIGSTLNTHAQQLYITDSTSVFNTHVASIDAKGHIYIADEKGNISRFTPTTLENDLTYSPSTSASITAFEARQGLKIFVFYRDLQQFVYLDRFLSLSEKHTLNHPEIQYVSMATPSSDNNIWLLDQSSLTLMKHDIRTNEIELSNNLDYVFPQSMGKIILFNEYQNKLFIGSDRELYIFDNLGNFSNKLSLGGSWYGFYNNTIYHIQGAKVITTDIYTGKKQTISIPVNNAKRVYFYENRVFAITKKKIYSMTKK